MGKEIIVASVRPLYRGEMPLADYLTYVEGYLDEAGAAGADIACLPEDFPGLAAQAESIDGPVAGCVMAAAKKHSMYVILPIVEAVDDGKYMSAILIDRRGEIVGRYFKTHPTPMEMDDWGISPGNDIPVFETDFGTIGIMICFDGYFPELAAIMSRKGARIIFYPHFQDSPEIETHRLHMQARAMDNCVYLVSSTFGIPKDQAWMAPDPTVGFFVGYYPSCVIGPDGRFIACSGWEEGLLTAKIDIDRKWLVHGHGEPGICDMKWILNKHRRPELYRREDDAAAN